MTSVPDSLPPKRDQVSSTPGQPWRGRVPALAWVIFAAIAARALLLFSTEYVPGMNGAYYLVQARALLDRGGLGIPDLPLTFCLQAAVARVLMALAGLSQADAIVAAVKGCDALLPALAAWPVYVLVRRWALATHGGTGVPLAAAALVCLGAPSLRMVGDLQKNSLALVWLAALVAALPPWLEHPTRRRGAAVLMCLGLLGLTHIGVLGTALVLLGLVLILWLLRQRGQVGWQPLLPWLAGSALVVLLATTLVLWRFDPARIRRLVTALTDPAAFAVDGRQGPAMTGWVAWLQSWLPWLGFALAVVPGGVLAWRRRPPLAAGDAVTLAALAATVLGLTGPWFGTEKAMRFYLIAWLPAIAVAAFGVLQVARARRRQWLVGGALVLGIGGALPGLARGGQPVVTDATMGELRGLSPYVSQPAGSLIVTEHGVEWWTAWFLHTHIAQREAVRAADWERYAAVFFLELKPGARAAGVGGPGPWVGLGGPPGPGPRPGDGTAPGGPGPPSVEGPTAVGPGTDAGPRSASDSGPPAATVEPAGPVGGRGQTDPPAPPSGSPRSDALPGPPMAMQLPADAQVLYDGAALRLARVTAAPPQPLADDRPAQPH